MAWFVAVGFAFAAARGTLVANAAISDAGEARLQGSRTVAQAAGLGVLALALIAAAAAMAWQVGKSREGMAVARALTGGDPERAPDLIRRYGCGGCHTISSIQGADGQVGPSLDGIRKRVYLGGALRNTPDNLAHWIVAPRNFAPNSAMPPTGASESEARDIAAFLYAH
jgi:cytochrome c2